MDSAALLMLNEQQFVLFGQIQTSQTGGHLYSDTSPYGECSLLRRLKSCQVRMQEFHPAQF